MHHPICVTDHRPCRLGREGHCASCPHRGQRDPRWARVSQIQMYAASIERGLPWSDVPDDIAAVLWPASERQWIERGDEWATRARYWAEIHTQDFIRDLLREVFDLGVTR